MEKIIKPLFDAVRYGTDLEFKYTDKYYFITSGMIYAEGINAHSIRVAQTENSVYESKNTLETFKVIYNCQSEDCQKNTDDLFSAHIFKGKTLRDIIDDITDISY